MLCWPVGTLIHYRRCYPTPRIILGIYLVWHWASEVASGDTKASAYRRPEAAGKSTVYHVVPVLYIYIDNILLLVAIEPRR